MSTYDYAGLNASKMYIPNLVDGMVTDGYGNENTVEGRLISSSNGDYRFYVPIDAWMCKPDSEYWYSRYTGSYFSVTEVDHSLYDEMPEWESAGYTAEWVGESCRFVTHEGMSNTVVTLFKGPNNICCIVEIHWLFDGNTEENQWGWNHDRAVEGEAVILQAMVNSFQTSKILFTEKETSDSATASTGIDALDNALDALGDMSVFSHALRYHDLSRPSGTEAEEHNNTNIDYRTTMAEQFRQYSWKETGNLYHPGNEEFMVSCGRWTFTLFGNYKNVLSFYDWGDGQKEGTRYSYEITDAGAETAAWNAFCEWYEKTATDGGTQTSTTTANTVSRDSLIKSADSYVDLGGYLWYTAGGKFYRWHEGGSVETLYDLPINDVTNQTAAATLSIVSDRVALSYHVGGATTGTSLLVLYGADGKPAMELDGSAPYAISGNTVVQTRSFPPSPDNLRLSTDGGKTWTSIGDADYFYGSVTEDNGSASYMLPDLEIRDGYVYATAVYDISHQKTNDPLVTHKVRVNLKTGAQEILD